MLHFSGPNLYQIYKIKHFEVAPTIIKCVGDNYDAYESDQMITIAYKLYQAQA